MKKLYQSAKWKRYSRKVSRRVLKKNRQRSRKLRIRRNRSNIRWRQNTKASRHYKHIKRKKGKVKITVPSVFSIIDNTEETLAFFDVTKEYVSQKIKIYFDMSKVEKMTADAILYTLSLFDYWKKRYGFINVAGNVPLDESCKMLLIESGFFRHVIPADVKLNQSNPHILSIESDYLAESPIAKKVVDFAYEHLKKEKSNESKSIFATLVECMGNTKEHAYLKDNLLPKWWLIALYDQNVERVHFAFVDNGMGIPGTVRKKFMERIKEYTGGVLGNVQDSMLIDSALKGEFRTKTKLGYRGNGLPKILSYSEKKEIDNLIIISNKGYVNSTTPECKELARKFNGTLLSWDFVP